MAIQLADKVYLNGSEQTVSAPVVQEVNRLLNEFEQVQAIAMKVDRLRLRSLEG